MKDYLTQVNLTENVVARFDVLTKVWLPVVLIIPLHAYMLIFINTTIK